MGSPNATDVTGRQVLAHRLRGQRLTEPVASPLDALRGWAVQDAPPGAAAAALSARTAALEPGWLEAALYEDRSAVALYNARTATAILPADEVAAFATALIPDDDAGLKAIVGPALPDRHEDFAEPVALAVDAVADALDGIQLSRDELHAQLRRRLPDDLLPWCPGCQSHHARRGLLVMAGLHGKLCLAGRSGRQPLFARTDQWAGWDVPERAAAGADLVRAYLRAYGPSTPKHLAEWAGLGTGHAQSLWDAVADELVELHVEGAGRTWTLGDRPAAVRAAPAPRGTRLLAPGDPLLLGRDRAALIADPAVRKRVWKATGGAGIVLAGAQVVGLWRGRKRGTRLEVDAEALGRRPAARALQDEADRLASLRGCASAAVAWG